MAIYRKKVLTVGAFALFLIIRYLAKRRTSAYISSPEKLIQNVQNEFDIIIVGGGTSGCVLASRLSEDPSLKVLLLESGGSGQALKYVRTPSTFGKLFHTRHVYEIFTEPQAYANGRRSYWPRGRMLGGCSALNAQMAQYGAPGDFDEWAQVLQDDSWLWKNFRQYFVKFEKYLPDKDYPSVNATTRGSAGPMRVGYFNTVCDASRAFLNACVHIGIPFTPDFNRPDSTMGVSRIMTYISEKGERVSTEAGYLTPSVLARSNLTVVLHAHVTRILFEQVNGEITTTGIECRTSDNSPPSVFRARKEVILSAGSVMSPQILMLSGIGPADHLRENGIPMVYESPHVGNNLVDHSVIDVYFQDKTGTCPKYLKPRGILDVFKLLRAVVQYEISGKGPLVTNLGESAAFIRSDDSSLFPPSRYPGKLQDTSSSLDSPDLELFCTPIAYKEHGRIMFNVPTFALHCYLLKPLSTGTIRLRSSKPFDLPTVDPNYLKDPNDVQKLLRGLRLCLKLAQTEPLAAYLDAESKHPDLDHQLHLKSDEELVEVIKERVETLYHPMSSCRMAMSQDKGVVDSHLKVYGIKGLRICDASVFPTAISGHTAGACLAIAEKLADEIKREQ